MTDDIKPKADEILRRIGRNLLVFQQIEQMLKFVLTHHQNAGTKEDLVTKRQARAEHINKKMLGQLVDQYGTDVLQDAGAKVPDEEKPADWFTFSFRITTDTEFVESIRRDLKMMTEERNDLVHHFLPRWQPDSAEKMEEALAYLDAQRKKVLPMLEHLKSVSQLIVDGYKELSEHLRSPEYKLASLQAMPLVRLLCDVAAQHHRKDGWTYLAQAGDIAFRELPDEVNNLKGKYGFKTLKKLLVGAEMFEVYDEPLDSGSFRTLYKVRKPTYS